MGIPCSLFHSGLAKGCLNPTLPPIFSDFSVLSIYSAFKYFTSNLDNQHGDLQWKVKKKHSFFQVFWVGFYFLGSCFIVPALPYVHCTCSSLTWRCPACTARLERSHGSMMRSIRYSMAAIHCMVKRSGTWLAFIAWLNDQVHGWHSLHG